jgi:hypothetical protein
MAQTFHQGVEFLCVSGSLGELKQPFAKGGIQGLLLGARDQARLFNEVFISTEGDILHTYAKYKNFVYGEGHLSL